MTSGIYAITCSQTGLSYVGASHDIEARWQQHLHSFRQGTHNNRIQPDFDKYGEMSFSIQVLEDWRS